VQRGRKVREKEAVLRIAVVLCRVHKRVQKRDRGSETHDFAVKKPVTSFWVTYAARTLNWEAILTIKLEAANLSH
jgi:hypothetical protein